MQRLEKTHIVAEWSLFLVHYLIVIGKTLINKNDIGFLVTRKISCSLLGTKQHLSVLVYYEIFSRSGHYKI